MLITDHPDHGVFSQLILRRSLKRNQSIILSAIKQLLFSFNFRKWSTAYLHAILAHLVAHLYLGCQKLKRFQALT
jgi:hypothetical protein